MRPKTSQKPFLSPFLPIFLQYANFKLMTIKTPTVPHGGVHRTGKRELTIGRDDGVRHTLVMAAKALTSVT